jgi:hypothetical protein
MKNMPEIVKEITGEHIRLIHSGLPGFLESYHLYGSVALGAFDFGLSDVDFVAVVSRSAVEADIDALKKIHRELQGRFRKTILDGMYMLKDDIESLQERGTIPCLRFNDGTFRGYKTFDKNSVDAFELIRYGITVKGQGAAELKYAVDFDILIHRMRDNLNTYWRQWCLKCRKFPSMYFFGLFTAPRMIEWGVLGVSRLYYTFREKDITSKAGAGRYTLKTVPQRWHKIIEESMRLRNGVKKTCYHSNVERRNDALDYMDYMISECNKLLDNRT